MSSEEIIALLRESDVFAGVPEVDLRALAAGFAARRFAPGELAVTEGERGRELFLVTEGDFRVFSGVESGGEEAGKELGTLSRGEIFGEIAALTGGRRYASVQAVTNAEAMVNAEENFHHVLRQSRALSEAICRSLEKYA